MSLKKVIVLFVIVIALGIGVLSFWWRAVPQKKVLRVMTYSSFVGVFGPGVHIKKEFEKICDCRVKWIKVPDSTLFVQRLSLKEDGFNTDVVLGLDQLSLKAAKTLPWKKTKVKRDVLTFPARDFLSDEFIPYDWSPMSFLAREKLDEMNLSDLLEEKYKNNISLPSPRTSTVGWQFYYWIWFVFKEKTEEFLKKFKDRLYGLPPSWSTSYALFQRGHVSLSFSYLSSLLYHQEQNQPAFRFVLFKEGHPFQVELMAVSGFCTQCELARSFVHFLLTPRIQDLIEQKNYMFPVIHLNQDSPFKDRLFKLKLIQYDPVFLDHKEKWLNKWDRLMK
ncbi:MAG: thiamine ABC transporter substrate-binding protein [Bdellovibrionales bacterium]|nr:thiamine ABC transporter substrate-binding protein [Bdellovibrionales bacterium]